MKADSSRADRRGDKLKYTAETNRRILKVLDGALPDG
jgi:hypothetical protein